jgi:hypothetical protein
METIPATYGFPLPGPGYPEGVKRLCEQHRTLYMGAGQPPAGPVPPYPVASSATAHPAAAAGAGR